MTPSAARRPLVPDSEPLGIDVGSARLHLARDRVIFRICNRRFGASVNHTFNGLMLLTMLALTGCGAMQVASNGSDVDSALAAGKAVLISNAQTFNPTSDVSEHIELPGRYRPALTYWIHRETGKSLVLGAHDSKEGRGRVLTNQHFYYVLEPGFYDFAGFVEKTRFGDLANLAVTDQSIKSNIGFANLSSTILPSFYTYQAWVPPGYTGATFDGATLTHWYAPGYWEERGAYRDSNGIFVDLRGLIPNNQDGKPNFGSFLVEPGQIVLVPDFKVDYTHGACDKPSEGQWVCPLTSLTIHTGFTPQHQDLQQVMRGFRYSAELIAKVDSTYFLPGEFFQKNKMQISSTAQTIDRKPYGMFRVTQMTLPNTPMRKK
jgi:hypothetical protein